MCKLPHPLCSGWPFQSSEFYSLPSTLLFVLWNDECYPLGPGHYANPVQLLHTLDCTKHTHCDLSHPYSNANDVSFNPGTLHAILPWSSIAKEIGIVDGKTVSSGGLLHTLPRGLDM